MSWEPNDTSLPFNSDDEQGAALAATEQPIPLAVRLVDDERTPPGMVCMGSFRGERLLARCVLTPEVWSQVERMALFELPVPVLLVAREAPPGLQCELFALVMLPEQGGFEQGDDEPWSASVPGHGFEAAASEAGGSDGDPDPRLVAFPLGRIVRYDRDRVHRDSLPMEAADVLRRVIDGKAMEMVDKALEDLLGG